MHIDIDSIYFAHAKGSRGQRLRDNVVSCKLQLQLTCSVDSKFPTDRPDWLVKWFGVWCLVWCARRWRNWEDACKKVSWGYGLAAFTTKLLFIPTVHLLSCALILCIIHSPFRAKQKPLPFSFYLIHLHKSLFICLYVCFFIFNLRVKIHHVYLAMNQSFLPSEYATSNCPSNFHSRDLNFKWGRPLTQWKCWFFVTEKARIWVVKTTSLQSKNKVVSYKHFSYLGVWKLSKKYSSFYHNLDWVDRAQLIKKSCTI